jgi:uncharacterized damage-inducible protein DinB
VTQGEILADDLRRAIRGDAWHGPALRELLERVSAEEAKQHPIPTAHSIWELVVHIAAWARIAQRRIDGGQPAPFDGEDWPEVHDFSEDNWDSARRAMFDSYERLSEIVLGMSDDEIHRNAPKSERTIGAMVSGVSQHAAYHGGQIAILRKLVSTQHRRAAL